MVDGEVERWCPECRDWWPIGFFHRNPMSRGGRRRECGACRNEAKNARRRAQASAARSRNTGGEPGEDGSRLQRIGD